MKIRYPLIFIIIFTMALCFLGGCSMMYFYKDSEMIAYNTFNEVIYALEKKDSKYLSSLFAKNIQEQVNDFDNKTIALVDFISGTIISDDGSQDNGIGEDTEYDYGQVRREIQSSFCIKTSECKYYIAIRECTIDTSDRDNVGITSIYIIDADDWTNEYVYRGDGEWKPGINIVNG